MFFIGQTAVSGGTIANFQSDIIGLLTGTITAPASLSSAFQTANCKIISTVAPGWSLVDSNASALTNGVTGKVIQAPWSDDPTKFKPIRISGEVTNNQISFTGYESWNATTHVGTNAHKVNAANQWGTLTVLGGYWIIISASANHFSIFIYNGLTNSYGAQQWHASEYSREDIWNTVANGYPAWFTTGANTGAVPVSTTDGGIAFGRLPGLISAGAADLLSPSNLSCAANQQALRIFPTPSKTISNSSGVGFESTSSFLSGAGYMDANKQWSNILAPLRLSQCTAPGALANHLFGSITAKAPFIYSTANQSWQTGDEVVVDGITYMYLNQGNAATQPILVKEA